MRLRQLARKLEVKPEVIIGLLSESGHELANEANGKLTAEQVVIVNEHFADTDELNQPQEPVAESPIETEPEKIIEPQATSEPEIDEPQTIFGSEEVTELEVPMGPPADVTHQVSEALIEEEKPIETITPTGRLFKAIEDEEDDPNIEVIKAPKIELEGLKVIGKIDLPEPKPKPEKVVEEAPKKEERRKPRENRAANRNGRGRHQKSGNGNSIEEERKRQERIAQRRKRDELARIKKKKEAHYKQKLKSRPVAQKPKKAPIQPERVKTEAPVVYQNKPSVQATKKGPLKRFWSWLNGDYDKF